MSGIVHQLVDLLRERALTISVAESCSGGLLAKMMTDLPGSSTYFMAGVVAYSNSAKTTFLGVPPHLIEQHGAVSAEVAAAMADGVRHATGSDLSLSITGIAGPDGGTEEKPVGSVYLGLADGTGSSSTLIRLSGSRKQIRIASSCSAIEWAITRLRETASNLSEAPA